MIRITAGTLRGRRIAVPRDLVRPTSERARQAFFNIVGARIHGARFLDLFAGQRDLLLRGRLARREANRWPSMTRAKHTAMIDKEAQARNVTDPDGHRGRR